MRFHTGRPSATRAASSPAPPRVRIHPWAERRAAATRVAPIPTFSDRGSEALTERDLEYVVRNVPKGSPKRAELRERGGKVQVPYLVDPNTARAMYESHGFVFSEERADNGQLIGRLELG